MVKTWSFVWYLYEMQSTFTVSLTVLCGGDDGRQYCLKVTVMHSDSIFNIKQTNLYDYLFQ